MIKRYKLGEPLKTEACVKNIEYSSGNIKYFNISNNTMLMLLNEGDIVYGLGESMRGINKRGYRYVSFASDDPNHEETKESLYGAHNFLLIDGEIKVGFFFDTPEEISFDIGYSSLNELIIKMDELNLDLYIIEGENSLDIIREFRELIGSSYIAPLWAFGYQQSRWSYPNKASILDIINSYKEKNLPLECVYLDIDYMDSYKDFTVDHNKFPNFKSFISELKKDNIHLIPIIDAGVKIEKGYNAYEEGIKNNYFVTDKDGKPFKAAVWPGLCHFPDVLNKEAREWFGSKYKVLTDLGIDGFWNDMNEPTIFYTPDRLNEAIDYVASFKGQDDLDLDLSFDLRNRLGSLNNRRDDYDRMYHNIDGRRINHKRVHNLFGYNMTRAAGEALSTLREDRTLLFSRSSYVGMHRYGGIWTGDNKSWWSHLELNIKQMPALNMVGFLYSGADMGGFSCDTTEDLLMRWVEFSMFTPLMRNHSCIGTRNQELYRFRRTSDFRNLLNLRYALIPYLYSEYMKAIKYNSLLFKPLAMVYTDDPICREIEDQLILGDSIMLAPIYKQNSTARYLYLPENMKMLRFRAYNDYDIEDLEKGHHYIKCALNEVLAFILPNKLLPLAYPKNSVEEMDMRSLNIITNGANASYSYYIDDGRSQGLNGSEILIELEGSKLKEPSSLKIKLLKN